MPDMARPILFPLALLLLVFAFAAPAEAQRRDVPREKRQIELSFAPIVRQVAPAVVNIYAKRIVRRRNVSPFFDDPFFRRFFGKDSPFGGSRERMENSLGSGVVVRASGVVVTNHHVIQNAESVKVVLSDRREFDADILVTDERSDIAVLRIDTRGEKLAFVRFGDPDKLEVGDLVLAIGNPFGVGQTVSSGIVSGLARTSIGVTDFRSFIQTDAAINPGNSGGALVSMTGRLVGINTAIFSRTGGSVGIGFAVPSNLVRSIVLSAVTGKPLVRPWLSLRGTDVTADVAAALGLDRPGGVLVESVYRNGPAARAGLRRGDVIVAVDQHAIDDVHGLRFRFATRSIGERVTIHARRNGNIVKLPFKLEAAVEQPPRNLSYLKGAHPLSGSRIVNLSPAVAEEFGLDSDSEGVLVVAVQRGSPASRVGVRAGDIILAINDRRMARVEDVKRSTGRQTDQWVLDLRRGNRNLRVRVG